MSRDFGGLIRSIISNINSYKGKNVQQYGIKQGQMDYFLMISQMPGINQLEIAKLKNVGKASVTKALKILEEKELITRVKDKNDRRNVCCYVTEKGKKNLAEIMTIKLTAEKQLFDGFTEEDKDTFYRYLTMLHNNSVNLNNKGENMDIEYYLKQIDEETREKIVPIINYIEKQYPEAVFDDNWGKKTKIPTYRINDKYVSIACMKRYITIHFSNFEAPKYIKENYSYCKANIGCVNFSYSRELPQNYIFAAIDKTFS